MKYLKMYGAQVYVYACDIDNDGDIDVLSASACDNKISLFENLSPTNISMNEKRNFKLNLFENYPNPFNPITRIRFSIPQTELVNISVYNILGQKIRVLVNRIFNSGQHEISFNASNLSNGSYYYRLQVGNHAEVKKMILSK